MFKKKKQKSEKFDFEPARKVGWRATDAKEPGPTWTSAGKSDLRALSEIIKKTLILLNLLHFKQLGWHHPEPPVITTSAGIQEIEFCREGIYS